MNITLDDPALPHQLHIIADSNGDLFVSCNCYRNVPHYEFRKVLGEIESVAEAWVLWNQSELHHPATAATHAPDAERQAWAEKWLAARGRRVDQPRPTRHVPPVYRMRLVDHDAEKCWCGQYAEDHQWSEAERKLHCPRCECEDHR